MKHHIRTTIRQAAFGVAMVMAISAIPAARAFADNSVFSSRTTTSSVQAGKCFRHPLDLRRSLHRLL
jgi:hypothetical protein